jgi:glycosyltransferase involved in cell wall biosynthesis
LTRAGTESQLLALIRHLDRERVRPSLCLLDGDDLESRDLLPPDCPTLILGLRKIARPAVLAAAARLARFWWRERVDVVQTYFLDSTYFAAPLARLCGIRRVVRVRNNSGYWLNARHRRLGRLVGRLCSVTLTNSDAGREAVVEAERLAPNRVYVIENGVDLDRFGKTDPPDTARAIVRIGAVANLRSIKNLDGLIRAATVVCRDDPRVRFEVAGEGELRPMLESQIQEAGLTGRFRLMGTITDVPAFLGGLDVAVLCSHSESMSNALLEYMAAGRAIVATDVGANRRLVRHEIKGLIVPPGDDRALVRAIQRYLRNPAMARQFGQAARQRAEAEFSRAAMVRRFEDFYLSLARQNGTRTRDS